MFLFPLLQFDSIFAFRQPVPSYALARGRSAAGTTLLLEDVIPITTVLVVAGSGFAVPTHYCDTVSSTFAVLVIGWLFR